MALRIASTTPIRRSKGEERIMAYLAQGTTDPSDGIRRTLARQVQGAADLKPVKAVMVPVWLIQQTPGKLRFSMCVIFKRRYISQEAAVG